MKTVYLLALLLLHGAASAEQGASLGNSGVGSHGVLSVNQSAGYGNQQLNARAIAIGEQGAVAGTVSAMHNGSLQSDDGQARSALIVGNAFSNSHGVIGVNQTAGNGNQSANLLTIAVGQQLVFGVNDASLAQPASAPAGTTAANNNHRVEISAQSFAASSGVVQLNQTAGVGNQALNSLAIQVSGP